MPPWVVRLAMAIPLRRSLPAVLAYHRQIHYKYAQLRPHREHRVTRLLFVACSGSPWSLSLSLSLSTLRVCPCRSLFSNHLPPIGGTPTDPFLPTSTMKLLFLRLFSFFPNGIESTMMTIIMMIMTMSMIIMVTLAVDPRSMSDSTPSWWKVP